MIPKADKLMLNAPFFPSQSISTRRIKALLISRNVSVLILWNVESIIVHFLNTAVVPVPTDSWGRMKLMMNGSECEQGHVKPPCEFHEIFT